MRIISGTARGTKLYTLDSLDTRPTLDRVKESVFNIINQDINDSVFLDLFSGSGAIGLEASSRGAKKVYLCDNSKFAFQIIKKNIEKTHLDKNTLLYNLDFEEVLEKLGQAENKIDIVYLDPPYKSNYVSKAIKLLIKYKLLKDETKIIIETDEESKVLDSIKQFSVQISDRRKYGRAIILFLKYKED